MPPVSPDLDPDLALVFFRVLQEALTNIAKHANASRAHVALSVNRSEIRLSVEDNGIGVPGDRLQSPNSHGIVGMRERVARLDGRLSVAPGPDGAGTRVVATVPFRAP